MPAVITSTTPVSEREEWRTDPHLFALLQTEFLFHLDAAATPDNALCPKFFTIEDNALVQDWYDPVNDVLRTFCNPPFSLTGEFLLKGREETDKGAVCVFLVKADAPETQWWCNGVLNEANGNSSRVLTPAYHIRYLTPRVQYRRPDGTPVKGSFFPSAVIVMGRYDPGVYWWRWKEAAEALLSKTTSFDSF